MNKPIETWILGNKKITLDYDEYSNYLYDELWYEVTFLSNHGDYDSQGPLKDSDIGDIDRDMYDIVPITAYIHSGIALYLGDCKPCHWDSGRFGVLVFKKGEFGEDNVGLKGFKSHWEDIINGQVYHITVYDSIKLYDAAGNYHSTAWDHLGSCGGLTFRDRDDMYSVIKESFNLDLNDSYSQE